MPTFPTIEELYDIIRYAADKDPSFTIFPETSLHNELKMDSLGAAALVVEIERVWDIRIPDDEIPKLQTPADYLCSIRAKIESRIRCES